MATYVLYKTVLENGTDTIAYLANQELMSEVQRYQVQLDQRRGHTDTDHRGHSNLALKHRTRDSYIHTLGLKCIMPRHFSRFTITLQFRLQLKQAKERREQMRF